MWLYERLKMFVEIGGQVVDLNFHKFDFKGKEYTQLELINMIIERLEYYFKREDLFVSSEEEYEPIKEIGEIWALVLPAMWW